jgi:hypothetical protein
MFHNYIKGFVAILNLCVPILMRIKLFTLYALEVRKKIIFLFRGDIVCNFLTMSIKK